jgi:hypothetical protein
LLQDLQTIHLGKLQVEQDQARLMIHRPVCKFTPAKEEIERLFPVSGDLDAIGEPLSAQSVQSEFEIVLIIFYQQNVNFS